MEASPSSAVRQTGPTVLVAGCLIGVVLGSALISAIFKPDTPFLALLVGAGGFVIVLALVFFGATAAVERAGEGANDKPAGSDDDAEATAEWDVLAETPVEEPPSDDLPEPEPEEEPDREPEPVEDPLNDGEDTLVTVTRGAAPDEGGVAALARATELKEAGDLEAAADAYRSVVGTDDPMAAAAALNLGVLLAKAGDLDGAADAYGHAVEAGGSVAKSAQVLLDLLDERRRVSA